MNKLTTVGYVVTAFVVSVCSSIAPAVNAYADELAPVTESIVSDIAEVPVNPTAEMTNEPQAAEQQSTRVIEAVESEAIVSQPAATEQAAMLTEIEQDEATDITLCEVAMPLFDVTHTSGAWWNNAEAHFTVSLVDPTQCPAGSFVVIALPSELSGAAGTVFDMNGYATGIVYENNIVLVMSEKASQQTNVVLSGTVGVTYANSVTPGQALDLVWDVNGAQYVTSVTVPHCATDQCPVVPQHVNKWAVISTDGEYVISGIETVPLNYDGDYYKIVDTFGPGQECVSVDVFYAEQKINANYQPSASDATWIGKKECSGTTFTFDEADYARKDQLIAGRFLYFIITSKITNQDQHSYTDTATVMPITRGGSYGGVEVSATATRYGNGTGTGEVPAPVIPEVPGRGGMDQPVVITPAPEVTSVATPVAGKGAMDVTELPQTGAGQYMPSWMPLAVGILTYAVASKIRTRRSA